MNPARLALVGAAACMTLAACGGGDDDESTSAAADESTAGSAESVPTSDDVVVTAAGTAAPSTAPVPSPTTVARAPVTTAAPLAPASTAPATAVSATTAPSDSAKWQSPDGVFAIAFPAEPGVQNLQTPLPDGTSIPVTAYLAEVDGAAAIASCVVAPGGVDPDTEAVLANARDGALGNVGAKLVDSEAIELQGRPGLEFSGSIGGAGSVVARNFVDGDQICQVLVVGEPAIVDGMARPFLDSFEFLQEAA